ncbi:MAG: DNA methyltransferase [Gaiellaceae bacterium]
MPTQPEELRSRLEAFAQKWRDFSGTEKSVDKPFLTELLHCYGTDWHAAGVRFEHKLPKGGFIDMLWPGVCIVEMKGPKDAGKLTELYHSQAFPYWSVSGTPEHEPPPYVVMCSVTRFQVWKPGYAEPHAEFGIEELPERAEALGFLAGFEPKFETDRAELTKGAVELVTSVFAEIEARRDTPPETLRDFVLQCVWCMFAEDLGLLPDRMFTKLLVGLVQDPSRASEDELGGLFEIVNTPGPRPSHGVYENAPFVNGQLFEKPARVHLTTAEVARLREATTFDWKLVEPAIFGYLLEGALGRERQWRFGAHYTSEEDIKEVVGPTVIDPWRERLAACLTLPDVQAAQDDLATFHVLDPACGSGNFLYVAYRELRAIEAELAERERELRTAAGLEPTARERVFGLRNLHGIEREPFAVKLARVTLWMGHALAVRELKLPNEDVLPLEPLPNIWLHDALKVEWPPVQAIIGNPPYHGSQQIRSELGDDYARFLQDEFRIGLKDYAAYWFRKAHGALPPWGRAGFVVTNSISQNRNRGPTLGWILENDGVITNAVSKRPWPGIAVVNVSIVNWVKKPSGPLAPALLDGVEVDAITPALRAEGQDVSSARQLPQNAGRAFQGPIPADGGGFLLTAAEAEVLLTQSDSDYRAVVRPYLTSEDLGQRPGHAPSRYAIDFGFLTLEQAQKYPAALQIVRERVKPFRDSNRDEGFRTRWWQFGRPRRAMRTALIPLSRYVAGTRHGTRLHFCWCDPSILASDATNVFAFEGDYEIGILLSKMHGEWARAQSSTIRMDIRYTPTSAFETFPWPHPTEEQREEIGARARALIERRQAICAEREIGLTKLYNEVDEGAYADLAKLHRRLDEAVAEAYGWPKAVAHDPAESNRRLLELNRRIAAGEVDYQPFPRSGEG